MYESDIAMGVDAGMIEALGMFFWIITVVTYVYFTYTQFLCAKKCGNESNAYLAFIPIANIVLLCQMAGKPMWWCFLLLVPFVNVVIYTMMWIEIAKKCGHGGIWGFLVIVPFINFFAMGILAWGKGHGAAAPPPAYAPAPEQQQPHQPVG